MRSLQLFGRRPLRRFTCATSFAFAVVALTTLAAHPALATTVPVITKFCFDNATKEITFFATSGDKETVNFALTSSSNKTVFQPAGTTGSFTGALGGGNTWTVSPDGAAVGETHTFTITCTNVNGTARSSIDLKVVGGSPQDGILSSSYGGGDICSINVAAPGVTPIGLGLLTVALLGLGAIILRRRAGAMAIVIAAFLVMSLSRGAAATDYCVYDIVSGFDGIGLHSGDTVCPDCVLSCPGPDGTVFTARITTALGASETGRVRKHIGGCEPCPGPNTGYTVEPSGLFSAPGLSPPLGAALVTLLFLTGAYGLRRARYAIRAHR